MQNAITKQNQSQIVKKVTEQVVRQFLFGSRTKLSKEEQVLFLNLAVRNNLDPFKREIYAIKYSNQFSVVTGYQTYIQRATASGLLDGWNVELKREGEKVTGAKITIWRKDFSKPFIWEVEMQEFARQTKVWKEMPLFMIKKVAIAQGFRLAFPSELGGLPYTPDELPVEEVKEPEVVIMEKEAEKVIEEDKSLIEEVKKLAKEAGWFPAKIEAKIRAQLQVKDGLERLRDELMKELKFKIVKNEASEVDTY